MKEKIEQFSNIIRESNNMVFFGGAGVSTASNIPDFRSSNGLFSERLNRSFTPEQLVSHTFFMRYPEDFYEFYKDKLVYPQAKPNACHNALAELESMGKLKAIVTQNIDGLHQMAGSKTVYELHGSVHRNYCMKCRKFYNGDYVVNSKGIPTCEACGGVIKPDVVLYEEGLDEETISKAVQAISEADTLMIGGTSLVVYPAAGLIQYFKGRNTIVINKNTTPADKRANLIISEDIAEVFAQVIRK